MLSIDQAQGACPSSSSITASGRVSRPQRTGTKYRHSPYPYSANEPEDNLALSNYDDGIQTPHSAYKALYTSSATGVPALGERSPPVQILSRSHPMDNSRRQLRSDTFSSDKKHSYLDSLQPAHISDDLYSPQSIDLTNLSSGKGDLSTNLRLGSNPELRYTDCHDRNIYNRNHQLSLDMDLREPLETSLSRQSYSSSSCDNSTDESGLENDIPHQKSTSPTGHCLHSEQFSLSTHHSGLNNPQFRTGPLISPGTLSSVYLGDPGSSNTPPDCMAMTTTHRRNKQDFEDEDEEDDKKTGNWNTGLRPLYSNYDFRSFVGDSAINNHGHIPQHAPPYTSVIVDAHQLQTYHQLTNGFAH